MDDKKAYEQTIAAKLEALPLPDMADAIWARIETQLDIDLPTANGGGNDPGPRPGGSWLGRTGLFIFVTAFITLFLIYKSNNQKTAPFIQHDFKTMPSQSPMPPVNNDQTIEKRKESIPLQQGRSAVPIVPNEADSLLAAPPAFIQSVDSATQITANPPPMLPVIDTMQQKRKTRGVPGIRDNDYRIIPAKKDSS